MSPTLLPKPANLQTAQLLLSILLRRLFYGTGMCRAQGLAHQRVTKPSELGNALNVARGLNQHSVVEVITSRDLNVGQHRSIQEAVRQAVCAALSKRVGMISKAPHLKSQSNLLNNGQRLAWVPPPIASSINYHA